MAVLRTRLDRSGAVIMVAAAAALVLRGYRSTQPGVLFGVGSDDGVYFGAAVRLVHGLLPYRDYVLVHPPLIAVVLAPFAVLGELVGTADAFAVARLATVAVGAADVVLIGLLLRRFGTRAVAVGCAVLALHGAAVVSAETILLEPYLVLLVLAGLLVLFDGADIASAPRQFVGSLLVGLACAIKIWAVVPAVVLAAVAVLLPASGCRRRSQLGRVAAGVTTGFVLPVLPFAAAAPTQFVHDVFVSQLQRHGPRWSLAGRVASLSGLGYDQYRPSALVFGGGAALAIAVFAAYGWWARRCRGKFDAFTVFAAGSAVLVAGMLFVPDTYGWHYGGFFAPFLALVLARPAPELTTATSLPVQGAVRLVAAGLAVVFAVATSAALAPVDGEPIPVKSIDARIPPGSCVVTDNSSLAVIADRSTSASRCPQVIDPLGIELVYAHGGGPESRFSKPLRSYWVGVLANAQYLLLTSDDLDRLPWHWLQPRVDREFHRVNLDLAVPGYLLWRRDTITPTSSTFSVAAH